MMRGELAHWSNQSGITGKETAKIDSIEAETPHCSAPTPSYTTLYKQYLVLSSVWMDFYH